MTYPNVNKELGREWVAALRSGKYLQGRTHLRKKNDSYCCLGVLCDIVAPELWMSDEVYSRGVYFGSDLNVAVPPQWVVSMVTGEDNERDIDPAFRLSAPCYPGEWEDLVGLNDAGISFDEIADVIEKELEL